jgi:hypothetical protein
MAINYPHPTVLPVLTNISSLNAPPSDVSDGGVIRVASLSAIDLHNLTLTHEMITSDQVNTLLEFWAEYRFTTVYVVVNSTNLIYVCPFIKKPTIRTISGARFTATVELQGRVIPSYVPAGYGSFESAVAVTIITGNATATEQGAATAYGLSVEQIDKNSTDGIATLFALASSSTTYNVTVPGNRIWLLIQSIKQTGALRAIDVQLRTSDAVTTSGGSTYTPAALSTWYRFARIVNLYTKAQTTLQIRYSLSSAMAAGNVCQLDGITMIDITDHSFITESVFPTVYIPPEP